MIRQYQGHDIEAVLDIWLRASIEAHDFVAASFWESQLDDMRNLYIPGSETWVYEQDGAVLGFYSLCDNHLAATRAGHRQATARPRQGAAREPDAFGVPGKPGELRFLSVPRLSHRQRAGRAAYRADGIHDESGRITCRLLGDGG